MKTLDLNGLSLIAHSAGGIESCYRFPNLRISIDIGRCPEGADRYPQLFLTHSHIDHCVGLPYYVSLRSLKKMRPPTVYCPEECRENIRSMLEAWRPLDADAHLCDLIGVRPGDEIQLKNGYFMRAFSSPHRVPVRGYTKIKNSTRLREDLRGADASEIAARAKSGEAVNQELERAEFCFPGDTKIEIVETEPSVCASRVLLLECTFLGTEVSVPKAVEAGHIHLDQIAERASLFQNEIVILSHFSQRYSNVRIREEVKRRLPDSLYQRIQLVLPHSE